MQPPSPRPRGSRWAQPNDRGVDDVARTVTDRAGDEGIGDRAKLIATWWANLSERQRRLASDCDRLAMSSGLHTSLVRAQLMPRPAYRHPRRNAMPGLPMPDDIARFIDEQDDREPRAG